MAVLILDQFPAGGEFRNENGGEGTCLDAAYCEAEQIRQRLSDTARIPTSDMTRPLAMRHDR
jgi:hypothetical protein